MHPARTLGLLAALTAAPAFARADGAGDRLFRERVAPVLERRCVSCHSAESSKGGLALTSASGLFRGGTSGPAVVAGKPDESTLLDAVSGDPPDMPKKGEPLSAAEVAGLREWVSAGAHWPEGLVLRDRRFEGRVWWAFSPLKRPEVPAVRDPSRARNPIDRFVLARLDAEGLSPSPEADRRTLARRLWFDLLGLPPTPDELDAFAADDRPDAYERLVARLLASPRYGERWGRHWLDVAHYGDSHGYDKDKRRDHAWPYRDYVIRALNADLPYSRFVREQIAGDVIAPDDPNAVAATGFVAAGPWDFVGNVELREGTIDKAKTRLLDRDDMVGNTASTFLSVTVQCARCHDHKFDPIPQRDYYRLQAVFSGVDRGDRPLPDPAIDARRRALDGQRAGAASRLADLDREIAARTTPALAPIDARLADLRARLASGPRPAPSAPSPTNGYHSTIHPVPDAVAWVQVDLGRAVPIEEIRLFPARPTDFADTPGFGFPARFTVALADDPAFPDGSTRVVATASRPDVPNAEDEPYVIRPAATARYVRVAASRLWKRSNDYVFALAELEVLSGGRNVALGRPVSALDSIEAGRWSRSALVDGFDSRHKLPDASDPTARNRADLRFQVQAAERERLSLIEDATPAGLRAERQALRARLASLGETIKGLATSSLVYALNSHAPRPIRVLNRGEVEQPREAVGPGALACVPGLESVFASSSDDEGSRRAALAEWVASPKNVLTWRSIANRLWHYHFGRGLVDTPNDFGRNGSLPTHPELLDWLASELLSNGESLKGLHRLILTSATYRQVSLGDPSKFLKDADNRFLWRQNRRRLEAEAVRDAVLAVTGTLDPRMGGPGFDLFRFKDDHSPIYDHTAPGASDNPSVRRRTVYRFTPRSVPNPFLECMDSADPNLNTPARPTTITALQALALLNDEFMISQSGEFSRRVEGVGGDPIVNAYRLALARSPGAEEREALAAYAGKYGLARACRVLLNTNEFLFVD